MQLGHVAVAFTLASYAPELTGGQIDAFSWEAIIVSFLAHWLPNMDVFPIWLKIAKPSFHCTWSHSLLLALIVGLILLPIKPAWASLAVISLIVHFLADMPSSVGLPIFMPWKKRFTFNLWADTGHSGLYALKTTYMQAWTWLLEGGAYLWLLIRCYQLNVWPF